MTDHEVTQSATSYPTRPEVAMVLAIIAVLIIQAVATIRAATYEPGCTPAIMTMEDR